MRKITVIGVAILLIMVTLQSSKAELNCDFDEGTKVLADSLSRVFLNERNFDVSVEATSTVIGDICLSGFLLFDSNTERKSWGHSESVAEHPISLVIIRERQFLKQNKKIIHTTESLFELELGFAHPYDHEKSIEKAKEIKTGNELLELLELTSVVLPEIWIWHSGIKQKEKIVAHIDEDTGSASLVIGSKNETDQKMWNLVKTMASANEAIIWIENEDYVLTSENKKQLQDMMYLWENHKSEF